MGRGRAKAKQTKVARELKYNSPTTDLEALQRELLGDNGAGSRADSDVDRGVNSRDSGDSGDDGDRIDEAYTDEYGEYRR